jgi:hypothetical protein
MKRWVLCVCFASLVAGCGDPLRDVERLAEVELQDTSETASAMELPEAAQDDRPLFERLLSKRETPDEEPLVEAVEGVENAPEMAAETVALAEPEDPKPRGLLGFLKPQASEKEPAQAGLEGLAEEGKVAPEAGVVAAAYSPEPKARETRARGGLFSRKKSAVLTGPDAQEIAPGTPLSFGQIARVCALPKSALGTEVDRSGKYRLYDSAKGTAAQRPYYITGFDDGCTRQITGALAMFGSASNHEFMRYGAPLKGKPYSETDKAYEKAKRDVCRANRGKPCGAQIGKLEKTTVFVTVYDQFVGAQNWHNILLHDGAVMAMN